jgi:hypothetical protein
MLIPDEMRKCVLFIGYRLANGSYRYAGSAFWITRPFAPDLSENFAYLVTAKHVINLIRDKGLDGAYLRVNRRDGTSRWIETKLKDWVTHDTADVAAFQMGISEVMDHYGWPILAFATPDIVKNLQIGPGDDLFLAGMYHRRTGQQRNIPIVRMGNIAAMPLDGEPVITKLGPMVAYLIEARSLGGISGSPVFVEVHLFATGDGKVIRRRPFVGNALQARQFYLIGLMHGHYDVVTSTTNTDTSMIDDGLSNPTKINEGIAIAVPAERIIEVIKKFADKDEKAVAEYRARTYPTKDAGPLQTTSGPDGVKP